MKIKKCNPVLLFVTLILLFPPFTFAQERLAVMNLKAKHGIEKSMADALSDQVRIGIHNMGVYEVLSRDDLDVLAERTAIIQKVDCEATSQCLIDFGRSIGTRYMVAGSISKIGEIYTISLRLLDTEGKNAGVRQRVGKKCKCNEEELIYALQKAGQAVMQAGKPKTVDSEIPQKMDASSFSGSPLHEPSRKPSDSKEKESWFSRYKWWIAAGVVIIGGAAVAGSGGGGGSGSGDAANTPAQETEDTGPINIAW